MAVKFDFFIVATKMPPRMLRELLMTSFFSWCAVFIYNFCNELKKIKSKPLNLIIIEDKK